MVNLKIVMIECKFTTVNRLILIALDHFQDISGCQDVTDPTQVSTNYFVTFFNVSEYQNKMSQAVRIFPQFSPIIISYRSARNVPLNSLVIFRLVLFWLAFINWFCTYAEFDWWTSDTICSHRSGSMADHVNAWLYESTVWTNTNSSSHGPLWTHFNEILHKIQIFSLNKILFEYVVCIILTNSIRPKCVV